MRVTNREAQPDGIFKIRLHGAVAHSHSHTSSSAAWPFWINLTISALCVCVTDIFGYATLHNLIWSQRSPFIWWQLCVWAVFFFCLSFLPICLYPLNRLNDTHMLALLRRTHTTHSHTHADTFCCLLPQITSGVGSGGVEGGEMALLSKWSRANEFISETDSPPNHSGSN